MNKYHHGSRTFIVGLDHKSYSQYALDWGMCELFEDNDEIVILRVIDSGLRILSSVLTPAEKAQLEGEKDLKAYQVEAKRLLADVIRQNKEDKAVCLHRACRTHSQFNIVVELVLGRFQDQVQRMVAYPPLATNAD